MADSEEDKELEQQENEESEEEEQDNEENQDNDDEDDEQGDEDEIDDEDDDESEDNRDDPETKKEKLRKKFEKFKEKEEKKGLIYLSRIPPYMKPMKIRSLLSPYGVIGRIYLAPENPEIRKKRKKNGGNSRKNFTEGWVEFEDKNIAKKVTICLNNTPIGGPKGNYFRDDIWNIKYLPKFKWNNLTEKIAYDKAVREKKLRAAISQSKKENEEYKKKVEGAKIRNTMEKREQKKKQKLENKSS